MAAVKLQAFPQGRRVIGRNLDGGRNENFVRVWVGGHAALRPRAWMSLSTVGDRAAHRWHLHFAERSVVHF